MPTIKRFSRKKSGPRSFGSPLRTILSQGFNPVNNQARNIHGGATASSRRSNLVKVNIEHWNENTVRFYLKTNYPQLSDKSIDAAVIEAIKSGYMVGRFRFLPKGTLVKKHTS
jgi:hypothetical protein